MTSDVIIVGASVAGLSTAVSLLKNGIVPVLLERKAQIGVPVQCAEYVPAPFITIAPYVRQSSAQSIHSLETHIVDIYGNKFIGTSKYAGFNLNRDKWEQKLAGDVIRLGGNIFLASPVEEIYYENHLYIVKTTKRKLKARIIVGADGPNSIVAKSAGFQPQKLIPAIQWLVPVKKTIDKNFVLFHPEILAGYGWLFPKGDAANLGVGSFGASERKLLTVVKYFEEYIVPRPISVTGGLIPVDGARDKITKDKMILVGESAGLADPITGAGIANAYESGQIAGSIIAEFLNGKIHSLTEYENAMRFIKKSLERSKEKRAFIEKNWDDNEKFIANIRRIWLTTKQTAE